MKERQQKRVVDPLGYRAKQNKRKTASPSHAVANSIVNGGEDYHKFAGRPKKQTKSRRATFLGDLLKLGK